MSADVEDLLVEWELARRDGRMLTPQELAGDDRELAQLLEQRIQALLATSWMLDDAASDKPSDVVPIHSSDAVTPNGQPGKSKDKSDLTTDKFLDTVAKSGVVTASQIGWLKQLRDTFNPDIGPREMANRLVEEQLLTQYQASVLLARKRVPLLLDRYTVLDMLGAGGMGVVYKALHRAMERVVALKVLPRHAVDSPAKVSRFKREIKATARLSHPNIVAAYDAHEAEGTYFLVMEYVPGKDLKKWVIANGPMPLAEAVTIVAQVADGLAEAHRMGIVHRDVKPSNILLSEENIPKLLDLGLARVKAIAQQESSNDLTREGLAMGTAAYMAPEQARSPHKADARADIYSLGCTLYFLLTGKPMYERTSSLETILAHMDAESPSLSDTDVEVPPALDEIFQRMVAKNPYDRFPSMRDLRAALISTGLVDPQQVAESATYQARQQSRGGASQLRRWSALAALIVVGVGTVLLTQRWFVAGQTERESARLALSHGAQLTARTELGNHTVRNPEGLPSSGFNVVALVVERPSDSAALRTIAMLPNLQQLRVVGVADVEMLLDEIASLSQLRELAIIDCQLRDNDIKRLTPLTKLTTLDLASNALTDAAVETIVSFPAIEKLSLANTEVSDYGLKQLATLRHLRAIVLDGCLITDNGLASFDKLAELEEISVAGTQVGDAGAEMLTELNRLRRLNLAETRITPEGIARLARLSALESLRISPPVIDGALVGALKSLAELRVLELPESELDDRGFQRLAKVQQIKRIDVRGTLVTADGLLRFSTLRPNCSIVAD